MHCEHCKQEYPEAQLVDGFCFDCRAWFESEGYPQPMKGFDYDNEYYYCKNCDWAGSYLDAKTGSDHHFHCPKCHGQLERAARCIAPDCSELYPVSEYVDGYCPGCAGSKQCDRCKRHMLKEDIVPDDFNITEYYTICADCFEEVDGCSWWDYRILDWWEVE